MHRTTNYQSSSLHPHFRSMPSFDNLPISPPASISLNPQFNMYDIKDNSLRAAISRLIKDNDMLGERLQKERQKNYDLLEIKRKMEDDIKKMEFQIQRLGVHGSLTNREAEIKNRLIVQDNTKIKKQLDEYFQEIKVLKADIRKNTNQIDQLNRQKQDLVNQNVTLLSQLTDLKQQLFKKQLQIKSFQKQQIERQKQMQVEKLKVKSHHMHPSINEIVTMRSLEQNRMTKDNQNSKADTNTQPYVKSSAYQSPYADKVAAKNGKYYRQQLTTNPSQSKLPYGSPSGYSSSNMLHYSDVQQIDEEQADDYPEPDPSPRSFQNNKIALKLQQSYPSPNSPAQNTSTLQSPLQKNASLQSPSVISYAKPSPIMQQLRLNQENGNNYYYTQYLNQNLPEKATHEQQSDRMFLATYQKKEVKDQVAGLRDELVDELMRKYYRSAVDVAQRQKKNSLKLFITFMQEKLEILDNMSLNYLQARSMVAESCPTVRLKWQPTNPLSTHSQSTQSQLMLKNTLQVYRVYQSIKTNGKKQNNVNGQYLALFRYLTLLDKLEDNIDGLLLESVKHSVAKQVHRIKLACNGTTQTLYQ